MSGPLIALVATDHEDMNMPKLSFDARDHFLKYRHQVVYQRIEVSRSGDLASTFAVQFKCDLINNIDLVLHNPDRKRLGDMVRWIRIVHQSTDIDCLDTPDLVTQINTNCMLFGDRRIMQFGDKLFVPLAMAPIHQNNLVSIKSTYGNLHICIEFVAGYDSSDVEFYGNMYFLDENRPHLLGTPYEFGSLKNQFSGSQRLKKGVNTFVLYWNNPTFHMYFWGMDKEKVTNVKLLLNSYAYYDGSIEALEHQKASRGIPTNIEPVFISFTQNKVSEPPRSYINFNRIDRIELVIESTDEVESDVYIVGLSMCRLWACDTPKLE